LSVTHSFTIFAPMLRKNIFSLLLLVLFISGIEWNYLWFYLLKENAKNNLSEKVLETFDRNDLIILKIHSDSISTFPWTEPGKEVCFNNEMYDVVHSKPCGTYITFYCLKDDLEKEMLGLIFNNGKTKNNIAKKIKRVKGIDTFLIKNAPISSQDNIRNSYFEIEQLYESPLIFINSPPPKA